MPIAKKPKSIHQFITEANAGELDKKDVSITTMRLKTKFIQRMDAAAEHEGLNRTAWMVRVVTKYLNDNGF